MYFHRSLGNISFYFYYLEQPYTPTAQTPYMTPYQTPYQSGQTPRFPPSNQAHASNSGGFAHPSAVTPGYNKTSQHARSSQHRSSSGSRDHNNSSEGPLDWRKAAEAYARSSQQKGAPAWPSQSRSVASSVVARYGGAGSVFGGPSKVPGKSPQTTRSAAQVIHEGIQKVKTKYVLK